MQQEQEQHQSRRQQPQQTALRPSQKQQQQRRRNIPRDGSEVEPIPSSSSNSTTTNNTATTGTKTTSYKHAIASPLLYEAFDPSLIVDDIIQKRRIIALKENVQSDKQLTFILSSWSKSGRKDVPERCYQVLQHLLQQRDGSDDNNNDDDNNHLSVNLFLYNTVLNAYAKYHQTTKAESLLRQIPYPDTVSYNIVMKAYATTIIRTKSPQHDDNDGAIMKCRQLLKEMMMSKNNINNTEANNSIKPDVVTYLTMMDAYIRRGRIQEAEQLLQSMIRRWRRTTHNKDDDSCSSDFDHSIMSHDDDDDDDDVAVVVPATAVFNTIMSAWAKSNTRDAPERCLNLLNQMKEMASKTTQQQQQLEPNVRSYTIVIEAYAHRGMPHESEEVLRSMLADENVKVDTYPFCSIMTAWAKKSKKDDDATAPRHCLRLLSECKQILHGSKEWDQNVDVLYSIAIDAYAQRGQPLQAERLLKALLTQEDGAIPSVYLFGSVMNAWSKSNADDAPDYCLKLLDEMKQLSEGRRPGWEDLRPNVVHYSTVVDSFAKRGRAQEAENVLQEMLFLSSTKAMANDSSIIPDVVTFTSVMNAWSKSDAEDAPSKCLALLEVMKALAKRTGRNDCKPNVLTYSTVINCFAQRKRAQEAEDVLRLMMNDDLDNITPNCFSFGCVMNGWAQQMDSQEAPYRCLDLLDEMRELCKKTGNKSLRPNVVTYSIVINAFAQRNRPQEAEDVLFKMLETREVVPNLVTFHSVLNGWFKFTNNMVVKEEHDFVPDRCVRLLTIMNQLADDEGYTKLRPNEATNRLVFRIFVKYGRGDEVKHLRKPRIREAQRGRTRSREQHRQQSSSSSINNHQRYL